MRTNPDSYWIDPAVDTYVAAHTTQPDEIQRALIAETVELTGARAMMQISPDQGALLALFVGICRAQFVVEVGTFTGYSSLAMARALPEHGRLLCCDVSVEWTDVARRYWALAGVDDRIELRIAPAIETLRSLASELVIDLAFIDADKGGYGAYYEEIVRRLRPDGVILVDNVLWSGKVVDTSVHDPDTDAIRAFNEMVASDTRVESYILPISDGLTVIRKR